MKIITKYPHLLDKVQNIPGLASLCSDVWFMLPKERYQYSEKPIDNNIAIHHLAEDDNVELSAENDDINEAIFLSTYKDETDHSSDESEPIYDDED